MPKKFHQKTYRKYSSWWRFGGGITAILLAGFLAPMLGKASPGASAASCPELKIIFARGSGAERDTNDNFLEFKARIEEKINGWGITREYIDLDYEAIGVGDVPVLAGAFFGAGDAYDFGKSVDGGVVELERLVSSCPGTKYVLGGYSQGAMVVSKAIHGIDASRIVYAATFGDPKIYLPEGKATSAVNILKPLNGTEKNVLRTGILPDACRGKNLSEYRLYVPDCYTYEGMLGSYRPYQPTGYGGKLGTWCNRQDFFCSSYLSVTSHTSYVTDGLYEDASRVIANKIAADFTVKDNYTSPHDTVILIDSTGSMGMLIDQYKKEALNLATETLEKGGRVALYDYRDISNNYEPRERCNFETCTLENFKKGLEEIRTFSGGDTPESLLSASLKVMKRLDWQYGATKSVVVLTDAGYHEPDLDGTTFDEVVALSKKIDPVNFYIITPDSVMSEYESLAEATGGAVVASTSDLSALTERIVTRYDSLPRVEEEIEFDAEVPALEVTEVVRDENGVTVKFVSSGDKVLVALNDAVLGATEDDFVTISEVDSGRSNLLRLVPLTNVRRGEGVEVDLNSSDSAGGTLELSNGNVAAANDSGNVAAENSSGNKAIIPKAPNTGKGPISASKKYL